MAFTAQQLQNEVASIIETRQSTDWVIVQNYLTKPLLYKLRKFDIRCYALVVKTFNKVDFFWYNVGYARTSSFEYSASVRDNLMVHLTNEAVQVKGRLYFDTDQKKFGKLEPGNKVYFEELDQYF